MPLFDLGVVFTEVEDEDKFEAMPNATYDFQIVSAEPKETGEGRPTINWTLGIINNPEYIGRKVFYNTPMPWMKDGQKDISGIGFLVALVKAVRHPWDGSNFPSEEYIGLTGQTELKQKPKQEQNAAGKWVNIDPPEMINQVKKFVT